MSWAVIALIIALAALLLSGLGVWAWMEWRGSRRGYDPLAQRLYVDSRLEEMTAATLAAMREAARRASGGVGSGRDGGL